MCLKDTYKDMSTTMYDVTKAKEGVVGNNKPIARFRDSSVSLKKITLVKVGWCALSMGVMLIVETLLSRVYS